MALTSKAQHELFVRSMLHRMCELGMAGLADMDEYDRFVGQGMLNMRNRSVADAAAAACQDARYGWQVWEALRAHGDTNQMPGAR